MTNAYYENASIKEQYAAATSAASISQTRAQSGAASAGFTKGGPLQSDSGGGGGDDMLEARVAKLEANVEDIKTNLAEARVDIRDLRKTSAEAARDVAVILQKQVDMDEKLSKKPSTSEMTTAITSAINRQIVWMIVTVLSIAGLTLTAARLLF
ncbi:hypothetical protein [Brenneria corticis]|nr:hypothetical protein [Brenneria sp. CFCC 11842]